MTQRRRSWIMHTIVCRPMVVKVVTMIRCDAICRWPSGAGYANCDGSFRSRRRNWPHGQICIGITSAASSAGNGTSGLPQSANLPQHSECRWQTSSRRFDNDRGATDSAPMRELTARLRSRFQDVFRFQPHPNRSPSLLGRLNTSRSLTVGSSPSSQVIIESNPFVTPGSARPTPSSSWRMPPRSPSTSGAGRTGHSGNTRLPSCL